MAGALPGTNGYRVDRFAAAADRCARVEPPTGRPIRTSASPVPGALTAADPVTHCGCWLACGRVVLDNVRRLVERHRGELGLLARVGCTMRLVAVAAFVAVGILPGCTGDACGSRKCGPGPAVPNVVFHVGVDGRAVKDGGSGHASISRGHRARFWIDMIVPEAPKLISVRPRRTGKVGHERWQAKRGSRDAGVSAGTVGGRAAVRRDVDRRDGW
jgi:hypothetical protein